MRKRSVNLTDTTSNGNGLREGNISDVALTFMKNYVRPLIRTSLRSISGTEKRHMETPASLPKNEDGQWRK